MSLNKTLSVSFNGKDYEVSFPNNGQFQKIQSIKLRLLPDTASLEFGGAEAQFAVSLVEAEAHLRVMCPKLIEDTKKDFTELDLLEAKNLLDIYVSQIRPWYNDWLNFIFGVTKPTEDEKITN